MHEDAFLARTSQVWKMIVGAACSLICAAFLLVSLGDAIDLSQAGQIMLFMAAIFGESLNLAWMCLSIRCPQCKAKIFWRAIAKREFDESGHHGLGALWTVEKCPACGYLPPPRNRVAEYRD